MVEGMAERVLVTGSGKGIGRAIALQLAKDGFDLAIHCRSDKASAERVVDEVKSLGQQASLLVLMSVTARPHATQLSRILPIMALIMVRFVMPALPVTAHSVVNRRRLG